MTDDLFNYYKSALSDNLCSEYKGMWQSAHDNKEKLMRLAMSQQAIPHVATYAYQGRGLSKEYLLREFAHYINGYTISDADEVDGYTYGMYVDWNYANELVIDKDVIHIMFTRDANVLVPKTKCPVIYVSNKSNVHIVCEGFNMPKIYLFDESQVMIDEMDAESQAIIYKYSDKCSVCLGKYCLGDVREFTKQLKL